MTSNLNDQTTGCGNVTFCNQIIECVKVKSCNVSENTFSIPQNCRNYYY